jgi:excisionase family DNA binding protein
LETASSSQQELAVSLDRRATATRTFTRKETAKRVNISEARLDQLTKAGKLKSCRVGRRVLYLERHIEEFLAQAELEQAARVESRRKGNGKARAA